MELRENSINKNGLGSQLMVTKYLLSSVWLIITLLLMLSCAKQQPGDTGNFTDIRDSPEIIPGHLKTVGSDTDFFFGDIVDVAVLTNGKIVVLDDRTMSVHLFSNTGDYENKLSFRGRGPGEIQSLSGRLRTANNNMIALDDYMMYKISLYQVMDTTFQHVKDISFESSFGNYFMQNDQSLVLKTSAADSTDKDFDIIQLVDVNTNTKGEEILKVPAHDDISLIANMGDFSFKMETSTEYHTRNAYCVEDNRLYHVRTDSMGYQVYDLHSGDAISNSVFKQESLPLTYKEKEAVIDSLLDSGSDYWGEGERERLLSEMPDVKPYVKRVECDLPNGIWLEMMNEDSEKWLLISGDGDITGLFTKSMEGDIVSFDNGYIFISNVSRDGDIELEIYDYTIGSPSGHQ
jgi:hypothetical protein